ncbi:tetratricopeptide repeat protein, partial [Hafnia paralvei]|uniref:tetratricopeptide repeat protein n=1 Tax=Hafnia paralvei TaxID=546367 RepID=UPI0029D6DE10
MSNYSGALEDAKEASALAPNYPEAYICEGDVYLAMDQFDEAEKLYSLALEIDPSLWRSKSFKVLCT